MNAEKYFDKLNKLNELIISGKLEIDYLEQLCKISHNDEIKIKVEQTEDLICNEINEYIELLRNVHNIINRIEDVDEKLVLKYRYILHYSLMQTAEKMGFSNRQIGRIHASALKNANRLLKDSVVNG